MLRPAPLLFGLAMLTCEARAEPCLRVVALDAGHTDAAPGATSARGRPERLFNLRLAEEVEKALVSKGISVRRIPAGGLVERARAADGADLLLSIHHDSVQPRFLEPWVHDGVERRRTRHARGHSFFVSAENPRFEASVRIATAIGAQLAAAAFAPTLHHAEPIDGEGRPLLDAALGLYRFDGLVVLKSASVPALLFEAGVIANDEDEARADDPSHRARLVDALARALSASCPAPAGNQPPRR